MKKIALLNPSSPSYTPYDIDKITAWFKKVGFDSLIMPNAFASDRFLAGNDTMRARDIMQAFTTPEIDAICALRGGYGSARTLDLLDFKQIAKNKKLLIGFSDTTALQLALWARVGLPSLTGLSPKRDIAGKEQMDSLLQNTLAQALAKGQASFDLTPLHADQPNVTGTLVGGTLTLLEELIGTPYMPALNDAILFIEDVCEEPYKIDRMLTHLRLAGALDKIKALVFGDFYKCISEDKNDGTMDQLIADWASQYPCTPMWRGLPYGHSDHRAVLPIGTIAQIADNKLTVRYDLGL